MHQFGLIEHGVQRRMISVDNFFVLFLDYYFLLCCYMRPSDDVKTICHLSYVLTASGNLFYIMSDAHETANCSFTGITHISE